MLYLIIGFLSGTISGLGLGGGTVLMPLMTIFAGMSQLEAQCANLISYIPSASIALITHKKEKRIDKKLLKSFLGWGIVGMVSGLLLAFCLPVEWLKKGFAVFLILIAVWQWRKGEERKRQKRDAN